MKKSELTKIIKEELQKQMRLKEYGNSSPSKAGGADRHERNDLEMRETLVVIASILRDILTAIEGKGV
ncbi:MAG: hypothetical protein CMC82_00470 [Flavobacteriaceae bacterium]|nr:hypothetical protein [Flavobacteriaceae bacterium]|tara:strand:- start:164 stop:367 length:204 start_codon:yes stop_codon:yes gene_type:complete